MVCQWQSVAGCGVLRRFLDAKGAPSQRALAARLGTTEGTLYAWKRGFRRPGAAYRQALERIAAIPAYAWLTAKERSKEKRLRAA
jgi:transcriptional regulator with XRE-family HTH domain